MLGADAPVPAGAGHAGGGLALDDVTAVGGVAEEVHILVIDLKKGETLDSLHSFS